MNLSVVQRYGFAMGILGIVWTGIEYYIAFVWQKPEYGVYTSLIALLIPVISLSLLYRSFQADQIVRSFRQWLMPGVRASVLAGLILGVFTGVFMAINPGIIAATFDQYRELLADGGRTAEEIEQMMQIANVFFKPIPQGLNVLVSTTISGTLISLFLTSLIRFRQRLSKTQ